MIFPLEKQYPVLCGEVLNCLTTVSSRSSCSPTSLPSPLVLTLPQPAGMKRDPEEPQEEEAEPLDYAALRASDGAGLSSAYVAPERNKDGSVKHEIKPSDVEGRTGRDEEANKGFYTPQPSCHALDLRGALSCCRLKELLVPRAFPAVPCLSHSLFQLDFDLHDDTAMFLSNLHWWTTDAEVEQLCSKHGRVRKVQFIEEKVLYPPLTDHVSFPFQATGKSKGAVFVQFYNPKDTAVAVSAINNTSVLLISVVPAHCPLESMAMLNWPQPQPTCPNTTNTFMVAGAVDLSEEAPLLINRTVRPQTVPLPRMPVFRIAVAPRPLSLPLVSLSQCHPVASLSPGFPCLLFLVASLRSPSRPA